MASAGTSIEESAGASIGASSEITIIRWRKYNFKPEQGEDVQEIVRAKASDDKFYLIFNDDDVPSYLKTVSSTTIKSDFTRLSEYLNHKSNLYKGYLIGDVYTAKSGHEQFDFIRDPSEETFDILGTSHPLSVKMIDPKGKKFLPFRLLFPCNGPKSIVAPGSVSNCCRRAGADYLISKGRDKEIVTDGHNQYFGLRATYHSNPTLNTIYGYEGISKKFNFKMISVDEVREIMDMDYYKNLLDRADITKLGVHKNSKPKKRSHDESNDSDDDSDIIYENPLEPTKKRQATEVARSSSSSIAAPQIPKGFADQIAVFKDHKMKVMKNIEKNEIEIEELQKQNDSFRRVLTAIEEKKKAYVVNNIDEVMTLLGDKI